MIRNIVLDMGNVMLDFAPERYLNPWTEREEDKALLRRELFGSIEWVMTDHGTLDNDGLYRAVCTCVPERLHDTVKTIIAHWPYDMPALPGIAEVIETLLDKGYHLYVLSNVGQDYPIMRKNIPHIDRFSGEFISSEAKLLKPEPAIYEAFCRRFDLEPSECLFVDDQKNNAYGAMRAGLHGLAYDGDPQSILEKIAQLNRSRSKIMILRKIGTGRTAEVFLTADGRALKLFNLGYPESGVENELRNALWAQGAGLPVPQCFGRCDLDGRFGILYECVTGESLLGYLLRTSDMQGTVGIMIKLHKQMLEKHLPQAMDIRQWLKREISGDLDIDALPDGDTLLHGDFHPDNIQIDGEKVWVLDWMNLCCGDRMYDIARTYYLLAQAPLPPDLDDTTVQGMHRLRTHMAQAYLDGMGVTSEQLSDWLPIARTSVS